MKKIIFSMLVTFMVSYARAQEIPAPSVAPLLNKVYACVSKKTTNTIDKHISTINCTSEVLSENYSSLQTAQYDDPQKTKSFSKSFSIGRGDKINVSNIYGDITVKAWDKNEVKLDAEIKAYAGSDDEAQKLIDNVSISANKNGDEVVFKTNFEHNNGSWGSGSRNGKKWRREVKVYMVLYMPSTNALTASQQYGNINMDNHNAPTSLKVQYGNLNTGNLNHSNNYINVQYGKATIRDVKEAKIKIQYGSGLTIANADDLELEAQYTSVNIASVKNNINIKHQYGSGITIGYAGSMNLTTQYTSLKLGKLGGIFSGKVQYGKLNIDQINSASKIVNIDADYTTVSLGFAANYAGEFNVDTHYGSFKYGDNVTAQRADDDSGKGYSTTKTYAGKIGRGGADRVKVSAKYGAVVFK